jgi:hypothetical protein
MVCIIDYKQYYHIMITSDSFLGFRNLLLSDDFSLIRPWCSRRPYQDMTRYINQTNPLIVFLEIFQTVK